jgi:(1->4)-alpha-D-glucan 1-alpha-D-glucosylmutase
LLDFRLVDPDNRAAVDYVLRRRQLAQLGALAHGPARAIADAVPSWFAAAGDSRAKLWVTYRLLHFRAAHRELLATGEYHPVSVTGPRADHVIAFARRHGDDWAIAVAGRLFASLGLAPGALPLGKSVWKETALDVSFLSRSATITNELTRENCILEGGRLMVADAFRIFPAALLHCAPGG